MTEKLKEGIFVPAWLVSLVVPLIISIIIFIISSVSAQASLTSDMKNVIQRLDRIEIKFDDHTKK
jgi:hypothetical protein